MKIKHSLSRGRFIRLLAVTVGVVAVGALAVPTTAAASPQRYAVSQLSAVSGAVQMSGVAGIAWYVDAASDRVVVSADRSVSAAEVATIRRAAGGNAGAIRLVHMSGVFTPLLSAGAENGRAHV